MEAMPSVTLCRQRLTCLVSDPRPQDIYTYPPTYQCIAYVPHRETSAGTHLRRFAKHFIRRMLFPAADPAPIGLFMFGLASALSAVRFGQPSQGVLEYQRSQDLLEYHEPFRNVRQAHRSSRGPCADYSANLILSSLLSFNHHQS